MSNKIKWLTYDIETTPLKSWVWRCGETRINHGMLDKAWNTYDIICITYCYSDGKPAKALHWGLEDGDSTKMLAKFDQIIKHAQDNNIIIIGKNNKRFDDKHINTHRWLNGQAAMPDWIKYTQDLEQQLRKYFYLPSMSLDYVSELRGLGGKLKMEFSDWEHIVNYKRGKILEKRIGLVALKSIAPYVFGREWSVIRVEGPKALQKMIDYGKKDAKDTLDLVLDVSKHCEFKSNVVQSKNDIHKCKECGSTNLKRNGTRVISGNTYQTFYCLDNHEYAGRAQIKADGTTGKLI